MKAIRDVCLDVRQFVSRIFFRNNALRVEVIKIVDGVNGRKDRPVKRELETNKTFDGRLQAHERTGLTDCGEEVV